MQMRNPTGNLTFVYKKNKSRHVFLNSAKNAIFSVFSLSRPACVAAFLLIRHSQEVEQMLPWHPSGPCTPALPPTVDAPRRTPHIPGSSQRGTSSSSWSSSSDAAQESAWMLLSVVLYMWEIPVNYQTGSLGLFEVFHLFQHSPASLTLRGHTHTPLKNKHKWWKCIDMM